MGAAVRVQARQLVHGWPRVRDGTLTPARVASSRRPSRRDVERLLEAGQRCGGPNTEGVCREVLKGRQAWWTCVRQTGIAPTNNAAARASRPGVLWRKGRFGTQRAEGSRLVAVIITVVAPLTQQQRQALD